MTVVTYRFIFNPIPNMLLWSVAPAQADVDSTVDTKWCTDVLLAVRTAKWTFDLIMTQQGFSRAILVNLMHQARGRCVSGEESVKSGCSLLHRSNDITTLLER